MKRIELLDALRKVMPGIGEKNILLEGADSFMFDGGWLKTYNDSISVSYPFNSGIKCLVKAQELFKLLNLLETDEVKILILSDGKFQLSSGNTTLEMIVLSSEVFSSMVDNLVLDSVSWVKLPEDFSKALSLSSQFAASASVYSSLCGVSLASNGLAASDKIKAGFYRMDIDINDEVVIPIKSVMELAKVSNLSEFSCGDSWIHFRNEEGLCFSTRKMDVDFPRQTIEGFFDFSETELMKLEICSFPEGLKLSVERAEIMSFSGDLGQDDYIELSIDSKGSLIVEGQRSYGQIREKIPESLEWSFPKGFKLMIKPQYFLSLLSLGNKFFIKDKSFILMKQDDFSCIMALVKKKKE